MQLFWIINYTVALKKQPLELFAVSLPNVHQCKSKLQQWIILQSVSTLYLSWRIKTLSGCFYGPQCMYILICDLLSWVYAESESEYNVNVKSKTEAVYALTQRLSSTRSQSRTTDSALSCFFLGQWS